SGGSRKWKRDNGEQQRVRQQTVKPHDQTTDGQTTDNQTPDLEPNIAHLLLLICLLSNRLLSDCLLMKLRQGDLIPVMSRPMGTGCGRVARYGCGVLTAAGARRAQRRPGCRGG